MTNVVLVPALVTAFVAWRYGFRRALVFALLPALLLLPNYYLRALPALPDATFHSYAWLIVGLALLGGRDARLYTPRAADLLVLAFIAWCVGSEYSNKGVAEARNLLANQLMLVAVPYLVGRACARANGLFVGVLAMTVIVGAFVGYAAPFEARMGRNPFDFLRGRWPGDVPWDGVTYRAGLRRVAGPFAHAICHGYFFSLVLPFVLWMGDRRLVVTPWRRKALLGGHLLGLVLSLSRGPIAGAVIACSLTRLGWSRSRGPILVGALVVSVVGGVFLLDTLRGYVSVRRGDATSETQETAAYRNEMLDNYLEVVDERPWLGHGKDGFPIIKGQKSIDNQYLFLALSHGLPASVFFLALLVVPAALLLPPLIRRDPSDPTARLGWCCVGALAGAIFTQITVFGGTQPAQILLLIQGLAVGLAARMGDDDRRPAQL